MIRGHAIGQWPWLVLSRLMHVPTPTRGRERLVAAFWRTYVDGIRQLELRRLVEIAARCDSSARLGESWGVLGQLDGGR